MSLFRVTLNLTAARPGMPATILSYFSEKKPAFSWIEQENHLHIP
jgi:hypothetical protein